MVLFTDPDLGVETLDPLGEAFPYDEPGFICEGLPRGDGVLVGTWSISMKAGELSLDMGSCSIG